MTLTKGQILTKKNGDARKVLEVLGDLVCLSRYSNHIHVGGWYTEAELKDLGYSWDTPTWYVSLDNLGEWVVCKDYWTVITFDQKRRDSSAGIFPTQAAAEARIAQIKEFLASK